MAIGAGVAVLLGGCAAPVPDASPTPLPELAERPSPLGEADQPGDVSTSPATADPASPTPGADVSEPGGTATDGASAPSSEPASPASEPASAPPSTAGSPSPTVSTLVTIDDRTGDAGIETPDYADLVQVTMEDTGTGVRITVDVAADLPDPLAEGEVIGLGVDLFTSGGDESDYQLFADGGSDGWRAWLQTPEGFVDYPGTFALGGRRLRFEVPWTAVGGPARGELRVFVDWSQARTLLNASGSDRAPDDGRVTFERR